MGWHIRNGGCGGFLNPPQHPACTYSIQEGPANNPRSIMSLEGINEYSWVPDDIKQQAKNMLDNWEKNKLPLNHPDVQDWIRKTLGYFRNCWKNLEKPEPICWHASDLRIGPQNEQSINEHAGVHLIHKYYPEYIPLEEHFAQAYWGKKSV